MNVTLLNCSFIRCEHTFWTHYLKSYSKCTAASILALTIPSVRAVYQIAAFWQHKRVIFQVRLPSTRNAINLFSFMAWHKTFPSLLWFCIEVYWWLGNTQRPEHPKGWTQSSAYWIAYSNAVMSILICINRKRNKIPESCHDVDCDLHLIGYSKSITKITHGSNLG